MRKGLNLWKIGMVVLEKQRREGKTDSQIATELGVNPSTIGRWFKQSQKGGDKERPNAAMLQRIIDTYNIPLEEVLMSVLQKEDSRVILEVIDKEPEMLIKFCKGLLYGLGGREEQNNQMAQEQEKGKEEDTSLG